MSGLYGSKLTLVDCIHLCLFPLALSARVHGESTLSPWRELHSHPIPNSCSHEDPCYLLVSYVIVYIESEPSRPMTYGLTARTLAAYPTNRLPIANKNNGMAIGRGAS